MTLLEGGVSSPAVSRDVMTHLEGGGGAAEMAHKPTTNASLKDKSSPLTWCQRK